MKKLTLISIVLIMTLSLAHGQKNVDFSYKFPAGKSVSYVSNSNIQQTLDINGQAMDVYVSSILGCSVKSAGNNGKDLNLQITVDTLAQLIDSPQGMMGGGVGEVEGKTFKMTIGPDGKVVNLDEAKNTTYDLSGQGTNNLATSFAEFFPVMPAGKISQGHTWTATDSVSTESSSNTQINVTTSENKFEGFEEVDGMKCAKITSVLNGNSVMTMDMQGMFMKTSGTFTGNATTWFSPEAGYFVKQEAQMKMTGNMEMPNEGYSFPVVMNITENTQLKK